MQPDFELTHTKLHTHLIDKCGYAYIKFYYNKNLIVLKL